MPTNKQDRRDFLRRGTMAAVALSSTGALGQDGPASSREHHNAGDGRDLGTDAEIEHRHAHVKADYDGFSRYKPTRGNDPESDYYIGKLVPGFRKPEDGPPQTTWAAG